MMDRKITPEEEAKIYLLHNMSIEEYINLKVAEKVDEKMTQLLNNSMQSHTHTTLSGPTSPPIQATWEVDHRNMPTWTTDAVYTPDTEWKQCDSEDRHRRFGI